MDDEFRKEDEIMDLKYSVVLNTLNTGDTGCSVQGSDGDCGQTKGNVVKSFVKIP